ncbi:MAG: c-type cytochrome [Bryobacteraceae bacterium]|nr:c-type cytochrome [Bryobacteraceae bacterium]
MAALIITVVALGLAAPGLIRAQDAAAEDPLAGLGAEDVAAGKVLYEGHCAACHAPDGSGGRGASLAHPQLRRAADNRALVRVIRSGIRGTEMPATWQMSEREILRVAAYVRTLGRKRAESLPGDAARGRRLYVSNGCSGCHIVRGEGAGAGPELTDVGARRNAAYLRESLIAPDKAVPERFLLVTAATADGRRIEGVRLNEDPFTIQIRDGANRFHSLRKLELAELKRLPGRTTMPAYAHLPPADIEDLVAYLASLRGEP